MGHHSEAFVGIDSAKAKNAVAIAEAGRGGEVRYLGEFDSREAVTRKLVAKLSGTYRKLTFGYEAGPTGYGPEAGRAREDQPARCHQPGQAAARRRADGGVGSRPAA